jgi:hypothetical protein
MYDLSRLGSPITSDPSVSGGKILTLRMGKAKAGPVVSDNANFIVDAPFPKEMMKDPKAVSPLCRVSLRHPSHPFGKYGKSDADSYL